MIRVVGAPPLNYPNAYNPVFPGGAIAKSFPPVPKNTHAPAPLQAMAAPIAKPVRDGFNGYMAPVVGPSLRDGAVSNKPLVGPQPTPATANLSALSEMHRRKYALLKRQEDELAKANLAFEKSYADRVQSEHLVRQAQDSQRRAIQDMELLRLTGFRKQDVENTLTNLLTNEASRTNFLAAMPDGLNRPSALAAAAERYGIPIPEDLKKKSPIELRLMNGPPSPALRASAGPTSIGEMMMRLE